MDLPSKKGPHPPRTVVRLLQPSSYGSRIVVPYGILGAGALKASPRCPTIDQMPWRPLPSDNSGRIRYSHRRTRLPEPASTSLGRITSRLGTPPPQALSAVFGRWGDIAGAEIAAHSHPRQLRDGVLVVEVDQPAWATQLGYLKAELIAKIAKATGGEEVREIRLRVHSRRRPWDHA